MGKIINGLAGAMALVAVPTVVMESSQPGSSVQYRQSIGEGVHSGIEFAGNTVTDAAVQVGPLTQTLMQQLGTSMSSISSITPNGAQPAQPAQPTLPTPMQQGLADPAAK